MKYRCIHISDKGQVEGPWTDKETALQEAQSLRKLGLVAWTEDSENNRID